MSKSCLGPAMERYNALIEKIEGENGDVRATLTAISDKIRAEIMLADVRIEKREDTTKVFKRINKLFDEARNAKMNKS